jgi:solute carrier family 25 phosphate transporter 3
MLIHKEGRTGIWKGFGPIFVSYLLQGMFKYDLCDVFKDQYTNLANEELPNRYKSAV